jgi:hypothetical protein
MEMANASRNTSTYDLIPVPWMGRKMVMYLVSVEFHRYFNIKVMMNRYRRNTMML